jgi:hypothetical protein
MPVQQSVILFRLGRLATFFRHVRVLVYVVLSVKSGQHAYLLLPVAFDTTFHGCSVLVFRCKAQKSGIKYFVKDIIHPDYLKVIHMLQGVFKFRVLIKVIEK